VVGVDISAAMLSVARAFPAEPDAAPIDYVEAPATSIPLPDSTFDVAYCQQGLQHMSDPLAALHEIRRLLKPGGRLGIATWIQSPFSLFREVAANMGISGDAPQPSNFGREAAELQTALRKVGFEETQVHQRELVCVLEGGIPQALEVAAATSAGAALTSLPATQLDAIRAAIAAALEPHLHNGLVHLVSISNITSARRR
jgi:SAM-dependent methyltransferase